VDERGLDEASACRSGDTAGRAAEDGRAGGVEALAGGRPPARLDDAVGVGEKEEVAMGGGDPGVAGGACARCGLIEDGDARPHGLE
jgi:hypothetical protein